MEKILRFIIVLCSLPLAQMISAEQILNSFTGAITVGSPDEVRRPFTALDDGFRIGYMIPNYIIEEDSYHPGTYRFRLNGFGSFDEPGAVVTLWD